MDNYIPILDFDSFNFHSYFVFIRDWMKYVYIFVEVHSLFQWGVKGRYLDRNAGVW